MITLTEVTLVTRNARDKIQLAFVSLQRDNDVYYIKRLTGQHQGKLTVQPDLTIDEGKAKRNVYQQAELQFNSIVNKYLDKGYKDLKTLTIKNFETLTIKELDKLVPSLKTDQAGNVKPMLAKDFNKCQNSVFEKPLWCSRKLNGVRMMVKYVPETDLILTISRGGKNYNVPTRTLLPSLKPFFDKYPDLILDGELYVHGKYLQEISGIARLETWSERCEVLEYWIYDIASDQLTFEKRLEILEDISDLFDSSRIKVLEHVKTDCWNKVKTLHDKWILEGFEGLVARKPEKVYEYGKRGSTMIKVKMYQEEEFEIIDYSEKLREEDFCFICKTKAGGIFEAKPVGTREQKAEYIADIDNIIGKLGTVKFFEWSKEGLPLQPVFQAVRYDSDIS
jgi:DNA ligase-1